jgi:hypothetical protein
VRVSVRNAPPSTSYTLVDKYSDSRTSSQLQLSSITGLTGNTIAFSYNNYLQLTSVSISDARGSGQKTFALTYYTSTYQSYPRYYLKTITESSGCDQKPPYTFSYLDGENSGIFLPPYYSKGIDFWGYSNGIATNKNLVPTLYIYPQLPVQERIRIFPIPGYAGTTYTMPGANRNPSIAGIMAGTLNLIQYPSGGTTTIAYEPNQYYDAQANLNKIGGGIRIKSFTYFDGVNINAVITKNYTYTDSTGFSSGRLISRPSYAAPVIQYLDPATGNAPAVPAGDWTYELVRTERDLSAGETSYGSPVAYQEVTVSRPGSGKARYQYLVPGRYGDGPSGTWSPSLNSFARPSTCPSMLDVITATSAWQYPYGRNPIFDFERGLEYQQRIYDNLDSLVSKQKTYYQYLYATGSTSYSVYGLCYEKFSNAPVASPTFLFSRYILPTDVIKVSFKEKTTSYDARDKTKNAASITEYNYLSPSHHLITHIKKTAPDGTLYVNRIFYPLDYGTIPSGADMASQMIGTFQSSFRNSNAIEQYTYIKKPGDVKRYTGASVAKYSNFGASNPLPQYVYKLNIASPLTTFDSSYVDPATKTFHSNANYELVQTFQSVDSYGNPLTSVGQDQIPVTNLWGYSGTVPVLSARNITNSQFAFSDFETTSGAEFTPSVSVGAPPRTGISGLSASGVTLTTKVLQKAAPNYTFSLWLQNSIGSTFTIKVMNTAQTTTYNTTTVTWAPTSSTAYQYFETNIPIDPSLTNFIVTAQCSATGNPYIDDVSLYPVGSDITSSTYLIPYGQNSITTNGNVTKYTVFDGLGRQKYIMDTFKNIREKDSYRYPTDPTITAVSIISSTATGLGGTYYDGPVTFNSVGMNCVDGVTYSWSLTYNDPTTFAVITYTSAITTTPQWTPSFPIITGVNQFFVNLTVSHPTYGTATSSTLALTETLRPATLGICAAGAASICGSSLNVLSTYTCPGVTAPPLPTGTTFAVNSISGLTTGETVTAYQWMTRPTGTLTWNNLATTAQFTVGKMNPGQPGYDVQCQITTNVGRTGTTAIMSVTVVASGCN